MPERIGKRVGRDIYIHSSAAEALDGPEREALSRAIDLAGEISWNVARIGRSGASLLLYEEFEAAAFPALLAACTVTFDTGTVTHTDYRARANPPILHRKELLLPADDPRRPAFAALTRAAEAHGLFEEATKIGTRRAWDQKIAAAGLELRGHQLVPSGSQVVEIARHKTALSRRDLSQPMSLMLRWGVIEPCSSVFDYGCGQGDDVAILQANAIEAFGWDPHHAPDGPRRNADAVNLGFVLNVIEEPAERIETLKAAWRFADRALTVSVMLPGQNSKTPQRPYRDGFITSWGTFQRYFAHDELRALVDGALGERSVTLAPGIVSVFKDKDLEQEVLYRRRSRATLIAGGFVVPARPPRLPDIAPSLQERLYPTLEGIWRLALELGRPPSAAELTDDLKTALSDHRVGAERAIALACQSTFDPALLSLAAQARREDLLVHFALGFFPGATRYATLPRSIQRDVKSFFRSHAAALDQAKRLLFSVGDQACRRAAASQAVETGLGGWLEEDTFVFSLAVLARLPAPLRVILGCAEVLYDDLNTAHFLALPLEQSTLVALHCDDPARHFPAIAARAEIDLQALRVRRRKPRSQVLYLKSRYLSADDQDRPAQQDIDEKLLARGVVSATGEGPPWEELKQALAASR